MKAEMVLVYFQRQQQHVSKINLINKQTNARRKFKKNIESNKSIRIDKRSISLLLLLFIKYLKNE